MGSEKTLEWSLIAEYKNEIVNTGTAYFIKRFELYVCRDGQIAWSPHKDCYAAHINPQNGVFTNNVTSGHIGTLLAQMAEFELKIPVDPKSMVGQNPELIRRILLEFQRYKPRLQG